MLEDIFIGKFKKEFIENINRISHEEKEANIQIRLKFGDKPERPIFYAITKDYVLLRQSSFKDVMNIKIDFLGKEGLIVPVLYEAMKKQCIKFGTNIPDFSAYLFKLGDTIGVAIYDKSERKLLCKIEELFA
jgi:hypothetical protein